MTEDMWIACGGQGGCMHGSGVHVWVSEGCRFVHQWVVACANGYMGWV